jgi:hypothetical protein
VLHQFLQTANQPFCGNCGWNLNRAQVELAKRGNTLKILATVVFLSTAALVAVAIRQRGVPEFFPLPLLIGVIASLTHGITGELKRALSEALLTAKSDAVTSGRIPLPPLFLQTVQAPRPRRIALRLIAKLAIFFFAVLMVVPCVTVHAVANSLRAGPLDIKELYPLAPLFAVLIIARRDGRHLQERSQETGAITRR